MKIKIIILIMTKLVSNLTLSMKDYLIFIIKKMNRIKIIQVGKLKIKRTMIVLLINTKPKKIIDINMNLIKKVNRLSINTLQYLPE